MSGSLTETREALSEIEQYLADTLPPLLVVGSLRLLVEECPDLFAAHLVEWAKERAPGNHTEQVEWLSNALRRFSILAELKVLHRQQLEHLLKVLQPVLLRRSPPQYHDGLRLVFHQLLEMPSRPAQYQVPKGIELDEITVQSSEHLARNLLPLIDKMAAARTKSGTDSQPPITDEMITQLLAAATRTAGSSQELNERLEKLKALGLDTDVGSVLHTLGRSLPNWAIVPPPPEPPKPGQTEPEKPAAVPRFRDNRLKAMERIVELSEAPEENSKRFSYMVRTAIEQFNQGALGRAVAILDSARQLVNEGKVTSPVTHPIWAAAEEEIGLSRLGEYACDPFSQDLLQRFLGFFPSLAPRALLSRLKTGNSRFPRRLLMSLLQVGGEESRRLLLEDVARLTEEKIPETSPAWDYLRDALSLLGALAIPDASPDHDEIDIVARLTGSDIPLPAFRELVRYFEVIRSGGACAVLLTLLKQAKIRADRASNDPDETAEPAWLLLVERILTRLAVYDNASARHAVLEHCIGPSRLRGVTTAPLAGFASVDLTTDPKCSRRLLTELKVTLPFPLFRWLRKRREKRLLILLRALSGTKSPAVTAAFADIARRFPDASFGQMAGSLIGLPQQRRAAEQPDAEQPGAEQPAVLEPVEPAVPSLPLALPEPAVPSLPLAIPETPAQKPPLLESPLASFDLPALLQHLVRQKTTGVLELLGPSDEVRGHLVLDQGNVRGCSAGSLKGEEALFLLMEKPVNGRFRLVSTEHRASGVEPAPFPLLACLMEGMRRHDEYRQACLIVPDDAVLLPTPGQPTAPEEETDLRILKPLWEKAISGKTAVECEIEFMTDPYRIRRVLSHWVAEGALRPAA